MKRSNVPAIVLTVLAALTLGTMVCFLSGARGCGKYSFQLLVVENGKPVPADRIKNVKYLSFGETTEAIELAAMLSGSGQDQAESMWDPRPGVLEKDAWHVSVPISVCTYSFGFWRTRSWRRAGVVEVELADGRKKFQAYEVSSLDGDRTIVVNVGLKNVRMEWFNDAQELTKRKNDVSYPSCHSYLPHRGLNLYWGSVQENTTGYAGDTEKP